MKYNIINQDNCIGVNGYQCSYAYLNLNGNIVKNSPISNPYNFDEYVQWRGNYNEYDSAVYSDRLYQWDPKKYKSCYIEIFKNEGQIFYDKNPKEVNKFMNMYFGKDVELTAILCGCNNISGYPYWIFLYRELK